MPIPITQRYTGTSSNPLEDALTVAGILGSLVAVGWLLSLL